MVIRSSIVVRSFIMSALEDTVAGAASVMTIGTIQLPDMTARRLALVLVLYLAADFVDASAPGVFFFDSALFLGTVVQSKARGADAVHHAHDAYTAVADEFAAATDERSSTDRVRRTPVVVATYAPFARDATFNSPPPATAEDH